MAECENGFGVGGAILGGCQEIHGTGWAAGVNMVFGVAGATLKSRQVPNMGCMADGARMDSAWHAPFSEAAPISRRRPG